MRSPPQLVAVPPRAGTPPVTGPYAYQGILRYLTSPRKCFPIGVRPTGGYKANTGGSIGFPFIDKETEARRGEGLSNVMGQKWSQDANPGRGAGADSRNSSSRWWPGQLAPLLAPLLAKVWSPEGHRRPGWGGRRWHDRGTSRIRYEASSFPGGEQGVSRDVTSPL